MVLLKIILILSKLLLQERKSVITAGVPDWIDALTLKNESKKRGDEGDFLMITCLN
jgi:hypothetical protein